MSLKPSEQFHDTLLSLYKEMVHEALLESNHLEFLDDKLFKHKLKNIMKAAKVDGLTPEDVHSLVEAAKKETQATRRKVG